MEVITMLLCGMGGGRIAAVREEASRSASYILAPTKDFPGHLLGLRAWHTVQPCNEKDGSEEGQARHGG